MIENIESSAELPDTAAMRGETRLLIERCIDALPEIFRAVFVLRALEELSVEEAAASLYIPEAAVRTRICSPRPFRNWAVIPSKPKRNMIFRRTSSRARPMFCDSPPNWSKVR
jgi:predicted RNA polymerase sigma factor